MTRLKLTHNLSDVQLEEALEKALKGLRKYDEPNRKYPDKLANAIKDEGDRIFQKVIDNMLAEIRAVIEQK